MRDPCVYLPASHYQGTLYCGVTSDLIGRIWQHRSDAASSQISSPRRRPGPSFRR